MSQEAEEDTGDNSESSEIISVLVDVVPEFTDSKGWASVLGDEIDIGRAFISVGKRNVVSCFNVGCAVHIDAERVFFA